VEHDVIFINIKVNKKPSLVLFGSWVFSLVVQDFDV